MVKDEDFHISLSINLLLPSHLQSLAEYSPKLIMPSFGLHSPHASGNSPLLRLTTTWIPLPITVEEVEVDLPPPHTLPCPIILSPQSLLAKTARSTSSSSLEEIGGRLDVYVYFTVLCYSSSLAFHTVYLHVYMHSIPIVLIYLPR